MTRPPRLDGVRELRAIDVVRLVWWIERGYVHGLRHAPTPGARAGAGALAVITVLLWPVAVAAQFVQVARPSVRYYLSPEGDAVLGLRAHRDVWSVEDHVSRHPGAGRGVALRRRIVPALLDHADSAGITITARAATTNLATRYVDEMPGLIDVGPARPRGRLLVRRPQP